MEHACNDLAQHIASTSAPWRSLPAWPVPATVCGSAPDSRRLFLTGAKVGTNILYLERRRQLRPPRRNNLPQLHRIAKQPPAAPAPAAPTSNKDLRRLRWDYEEKRFGKRSAEAEDVRLTTFTVVTAKVGTSPLAANGLRRRRPAGAIREPLLPFVEGLPERFQPT